MRRSRGGELALIPWTKTQTPPYQPWSNAGVGRVSAAHGSPLPVLCKHVVSRLRSRVTREPALGVVPLWRRALHSAGLECIGGVVVIKHAISPSTAVCKPLAVLHHEV